MKNINKYNNNKIDFFMTMTLIIYSSRALFNGIAYNNLLETSKQDTWFSFIIGTLFGLLFILFLNKLNNKTNKLQSIIILLFTTFNLITLLNDFISFLNIKYLFEMPNILIAVLIVIPMLYILNKGIEVIGRTSLFMFYITIIIFIINSITLINYIDINNLKPFLTTKFSNIIYSSIKYFIYTINPVILIKSITKNNNKSIILGYIISSISLFIILFYISTIYNYNYLSLFNYPAYFILKKIEYESITNAENILSIIFIIDYFFTSIIYFYIIKVNLSNLIKNYTDVIFIIYSILLTLISIFMYNDILTIEFLKQYLYLILSTSFIIFYVLTKIKKA